MKIDPKSIPRAARSCPEASKIDSKSIPRPSRDAPWCPRAFGRPPGSVSEASWGAPGTPRNRPDGSHERPGTPGGAPGNARECSGVAKMDAKSHSGAQNSMFSFANRRRSDFPSISVQFRVFRKVCEVSKVSRLSANSRVRPLALRVMSLAQCCLEKQRKSIPKSTRNRRKLRLGPSRAPLSVDFCCSKRLGRATRAIRGGSDGPGARWGWLDEPYRWAKLDATAKLHKHRWAISL